MSDSAKGPLAGYIFQFEKALLLLAGLEEPSSYIAIEEVDDVSTHTSDGTVLSTIQAKHSIAISGTTFEDTSKALWRTFEIWIEKLEKGVFNSNTEFICATNKQVDSTSLLRRIKEQTFEKAIKATQELLKSQEDKLKEYQATDPKLGNTIKQTISRIRYVLFKEDSFKIIQANLQIHDQETVKEQFLNRIHTGSDTFSQMQKDEIYNEFNGWIIMQSKAKWKNDTEAKFTKKDFDDKYLKVIKNPAIVNAIFRRKEALGTLKREEILKKNKELFVRQIEDIKRREEAKKRIMHDAIVDYLCCDIEMKYIIEQGNYTEEDFEEFLDSCCNTWQSIFDKKVTKEFCDYTEDEKNQLAIDLYDTVMSEIKITFKDGFTFNSTNSYVRNGSFLKLSDLPRIGWHPEWETKYKGDEKG